jgi:hypothetical protein
MSSVQPTAIHLIKIEKPRSAYLMGPTHLLDAARAMGELKRREACYFTFQGLGDISAHIIEVAGGIIHEIEATSAAQIIEAFGLGMGEEGIPLETIEGA